MPRKCAQRIPHARAVAGKRSGSRRTKAEWPASDWTLSVFIQDMTLKHNSLALRPWRLSKDDSLFQHGQPNPIAGRRSGL
jgi:hypothetical protein